jgi:hypothetical protein
MTSESIGPGLLLFLAINVVLILVHAVWSLQDE